LLDAKRNRKSEQLSADQLALFATAWQARQAEVESPSDNTSSENDPVAIFCATLSTRWIASDSSSRASP
jgi:hypothetical protein